MALSGYDPLAASRIWQQVYKKQGNNGMFHSTHPINSDRIKINKELGEKARQYYIPGQINPEFEVILNDNIFYNNQSQNMPTYQQQYSGFGSGFFAAAQTFAGYYQDKQEAKKQAREQNDRIASLQEIQDNMKIKGGRVIDEDNFEMQVQYIGNKRIGNLSIRAVSDNESSLYRKPGVVDSNETFNAIFDSKILNFPEGGGKPKIKLIVDEGEYVY